MIIVINMKINISR